MAILTGGYDGWNILNSVELYSVNGGCNKVLKPLPYNLYGHLSFWLDGTLFECGGRTLQGFVSKVCFKYVRDSSIGGWEVVEKMNLLQPRWMAAGVVIKGKYFIT